MNSDNTAEFNILLSGLQNNQIPSIAKTISQEANIVFIGGLWSHFMASSYTGMFKELKTRQITVNKIPIDTRLSLELNAADLVPKLLKLTENPKKLIIIGHSKGGLDAMAALYMSNELMSKTHRFISVQCPYGGSIYAVRISIKF